MRLQKFIPTGTIYGCASRLVYTIVSSQIIERADRTRRREARFLAAGTGGLRCMRGGRKTRKERAESLW